MTAITPFKYLFLDLRNCIGTKLFVSECSTYSLSLPYIPLGHDTCQVMKFVYMWTTKSVAIQNMGLKLELNLLKQRIFILLCLYLICAEYRFETFGSTSDQMRSMTFYLHTDVSLETWRSISEEIWIFTNDM